MLECTIRLTSTLIRHIDAAVLFDEVQVREGVVSGGSVASVPSLPTAHHPTFARTGRIVRAPRNIIILPTRA